jgi:uncharacterized protein (DUF342 family)
MLNHRIVPLRSAITKRAQIIATLSEELRQKDDVLAVLRSNRAEARRSATATIKKAQEMNATTLTLREELAAKEVTLADLQSQLAEAQSAHTVAVERQHVSSATIVSLRDEMCEKGRAIEELASKYDSAQRAHDAVMEHAQEANVTIRLYETILVRDNPLERPCKRATDC